MAPFYCAKSAVILLTSEALEECKPHVKLKLPRLSVLVVETMLIVNWMHSVIEVLGPLSVATGGKGVSEG